MKETLAVIAALLSATGNIPYLRDTLRNEIQPHPYTWLMWSVVSGVSFLGQLAKGGGVGSIPAAVSEVFTIVIFVASLRYGFRNIEKRDHYFLAAALAGLVPWALTSDPTLSIVIVVSIDVIAFIPTLRKAWRHPETERPLLYAMNVSRHILTLFALEAYNIATTLHSIAMIATNLVMTGFLARRKK
jgi:hypothetical protein